MIEIYKYRLYVDINAYISFLNQINTFLVFPSKSYEKIRHGKRKKYTSDKVMTRTWAIESPRETLQGRYPMPVDLILKEKFNIPDTQLVNYDPDWYPEILSP